jgi:predicted Zn-dependent protease
MNRTSKTLAATLAALLVAAACGTSPTGRTQLQLVSSSQMNAMGAQAFEQILAQEPTSTDPRTVGYVTCVAQSITRVLNARHEWDVRVFESDEVNAFALPGGRIGVYTGLLRVAENQHQLAAVIGHEIGHVIARHANARVSNQLAAELGVGAVAGATGMDPQLIGMGANLLLIMPYSRADESEADILGLEYMARAGFDPRQSVLLWQNMGREAGARPPEFLSTHPSPGTRIRDLERMMPQAMTLYQQAQAQGLRPNCVR